jgi:hypothetical protein
LRGTGLGDALSWSPMSQLTELLGRIQAGDAQARDALFAAAYSELHRLAHARLRDGGRNTVLDTTCLVTSHICGSCAPGSFVPRIAVRSLPTPHR